MRIVTIVLVIAAAAAGCGGDDGSNDARNGSSPNAGAVPPGGGLSVGEAMQTSADPPLAVTGWIVRTDAESRLCAGLLESSPPQCGPPSLRLEGEVEGTTGDRVTVFGAVKNGTLVVASTVAG